MHTFKISNYFSFPRLYVTVGPSNRKQLTAQEARRQPGVTASSVSVVMYAHKCMCTRYGCTEGWEPSGEEYKDGNDTRDVEGRRKNKRSRRMVSDHTDQRHRSESGATEPNRDPTTEYSVSADMERESGATEPSVSTNMKIGFRGLVDEKDLYTTEQGSWQRSDGAWTSATRHKMIDMHIANITGSEIRISLPIKTNTAG